MCTLVTLANLLADAGVRGDEVRSCAVHPVTGDIVIGGYTNGFIPGQDNSAGRDVCTGAMTDSGGRISPSYMDLNGVDPDRDPSTWDACH